MSRLLSLLAILVASGIPAGPVRLHAADTPGPQGSLTAQTYPVPTEPGLPLVFGGTERTAIGFSARLSDHAWYAHLTHETGTFVVPIEELGAPGERFAFMWDGRDFGGHAMPDGSFGLTLRATDTDGRRGATNTIDFVRDSRRARVSLSWDTDVFSPRAADARHAAVLTARHEPPDGVFESRLIIVSDDGHVVRSESGETITRFTWAGTTAERATVADGRYIARLEVRYRNGNRVVATASPIVVDTAGPLVHELSAPYLLFRPTGDGMHDSVTIFQRTSAAEWSGRIVDSDGQPVLEQRWAGEARGFVWDGRDGDGELVADGAYRYVLTGRDRAGNRVREELTLFVDTASLPTWSQPPRPSLSAHPLPYDRVAEGDRLSFVAGTDGPNEPVSWRLDIRHPDGLTVRSFGGTGRPTPRIGWDGRYASGGLVESLRVYEATLTVVDEHGNDGSARLWVPVGLVVPPSVPELRVPSLIFAEGSADLFDAPPAFRDSGMESLRILAEVLRRYPEREILLEGHSAPGEPLDLSGARVREVHRALVLLGVKPDRIRITAAEDARPVVPADDRLNSWKNRRVELILR